MLTTPHLLVGAAIGSQFQNPMLVAPIAAGSHFVLDSVPHLGGFIEVEDLEKKEVALVVADVVLGLVVLFFLTNNNPAAELIWLGAFSAVLPDFHHTFQVIFGTDKLKKYEKLHKKFHYKKPMRILPGMATQILTVALAILFILGLLNF